ncbi:hypothetical protein [Actinoplanes regularis]|uniref:hypothetical protein n=1 Tax=Actinoplanes regularis TaxID=52697 RepID=UPI002556BF68|nr:hypothetical protein [Actinoplanes regularis]GLW27856.1 hypothetical protein Areg01_07960 [Actinoplanes regularis]
MKTRSWGAALSGALVLGSFGLAQGLSATSATASPRNSAAVSGHLTPADPKDYRQGYRDGVKDGRLAGQQDCKQTNVGAGLGLDAGPTKAESDYQRGYDAGYQKAYDRAFEEFCS